MTQGDVIPARCFQRRPFREEFDHGLVDPGDQPALDCDAHEQRHHAFGRRSHVVPGGRVEIVRSVVLAPGLVISRKILFEDELAVADDDDGVNLGLGFP